MDASTYYYTMNLLLINAYREQEERMMFRERPLSPIEAVTHHNLHSAVKAITRYQELLTQLYIDGAEKIKYADEDPEPVIEVELPECSVDDSVEDDGEDERPDEFGKGIFE